MKQMHILTTEDVVCEKKINSVGARYRTAYGGETYSFCSQKCLDAFLSEPERFVTEGQDDERGERDYNGR